MNISSILASTKVQTVLAKVNQTKKAYAAQPWAKLLPTPVEYVTQIGICFGLGFMVRQFDRQVRLADERYRLDAFINLVSRHPELSPRDLDYLSQSVPSLRREPKMTVAKKVAKDVGKHLYEAFACANWSYYFWYSAPVWVGSRILGYAASGAVALVQNIRMLLGGNKAKALQAKRNAHERRRAFVHFLDRYTIKAAWRGMERNLGKRMVQTTQANVSFRPDVYDLYEDLRKPLVTTDFVNDRPEEKITVREFSSRTEAKQPGERLDNWDLIRVGVYSREGYDRCKTAYTHVLDELPDNCEVEDPRRFGAAMATYIRNTKRSQLSAARQALPFFILLELVDGTGEVAKDFTDALGLLVIEGWDDVVGAPQKQTTK